VKVNVHQDEELELGIEESNSTFTFFNFSQLLEATKNFSVEISLVKVALVLYTRVSFLMDWR